MREYLRMNGWNDKPQLSDMMWGEWIGAGNDTPYIQLKQNFDERHRDHFEITIRKLTNYLESEEHFDQIALECNVIMIQDIDKVEKKPYGFVQRTLAMWFHKERVCVCCGSKWDCDFGNNPAPVCDYGRCCDECNQQVIHIRFREAGLGMELKMESKSDEHTEWLVAHSKTKGFKSMLCCLMEERMDELGVETKEAQTKW